MHTNEDNISIRENLKIQERWRIATAYFAMICFQILAVMIFSDSIFNIWIIALSYFVVLILPRHIISRMKSSSVFKMFAGENVWTQSLFIMMLSQMLVGILLACIKVRDSQSHSW